MSEQVQTEPPEQVEPEQVEPPAEPVQQQVLPVDDSASQITPRAPVVFESDDLDKRFDAVKQAIESDEMLSPSDKQLKLLDLEVKREERIERRQEKAQSAEDQSRNSIAAKFGVTRLVVDSTWNEALAESMKRRGRFDYGTAMTILEDRLVLAKKKPETPAEPTPIPEKKPVGQTRTAPRGARAAAADAPKKMTVQEIMDRAAMGDVSHIPPDVLAEAKR